MKSLTNHLFLCFFLLGTFCTNAQQTQKLDNLTAFAKAYGYVKYFHPSNESANLDWDLFAAYGAQKVENCATKEELSATLNDLFSPILVGGKFSNTPISSFHASSITPEKPQKYKQTHWQHSGIGTNPESMYQSVRVHHKVVQPMTGFGVFMTTLDIKAYANMEIRFSAMVKVNGKASDRGRLWVREDLEDGTVGYFENMDDRPIRNGEWKRYELSGKLHANPNKLAFGFMFDGSGKAYIDDAILSYKKEGKWIDIPVNNQDFETEKIDKKGSTWFFNDRNTKAKKTKEASYQGEFGIEIYTDKTENILSGKKLFDSERSIGDVIETQLIPGVYCQIPMVLYSQKTTTYPSLSTETLAKEFASIDTDLSNLYMRLGNIINAHSVFEEFYPYHKEINIDWNGILTASLKRSYEDVDLETHIVTLQKMTAHLKDGHISVSGSKQAVSVPAIKWEWLNDQLLVSYVSDSTLALKVGDEITQIDGQSSESYFKEVYSRISAGTDGWLHYRADLISLMGPEDKPLVVQVNNQSITIPRTISPFDWYSLNDHSVKSKKLEEGLYYLNLDLISMKEINGLMDELEDAAGIICDLRGYPNGNDGLIRHLMKEKESVKWMSVANTDGPRSEFPAPSRQSFGWKVRPKKPYLGDKKILFITDGSAISYAESYMGYIAGNKLATIIGQPTAGANGNVNSVNLVGNISIRWTGMHVVKHNGAQHHTIGILPDVYVQKTKQGIIDGKDEFLAKAIELFHASE